MDCTNIVPGTEPPSSIRFDVGVRTGRGGILRERLNSHSTYWNQSDITEIDQVLPVSGTLIGGPGTSLVVRPGSPVTLLVNVTALVSFSITVNQVFVIDSAFVSFTITNPSTTATARVQVFSALSA